MPKFFEGSEYYYQGNSKRFRGKLVRILAMHWNGNEDLVTIYLVDKNGQAVTAGVHVDWLVTRKGELSPNVLRNRNYKPASEKKAFSEFLEDPENRDDD